jgi:hypothetical protein
MRVRFPPAALRVKPRWQYTAPFMILPDWDSIMATINVYCDESRTSNNRFMLIGGIWVPRENEQALRADIASFRAEYRMVGEMKWTKVSLTKLPYYCAFFDLILKNNHARFNCMIIDTKILNYNQHCDGDSELGFYKFYFQLISRKLCLRNDYMVFVDHRCDHGQTRLTDLHRCVNNWWCRERRVDTRPVRSVKAADSKKEDLIQLSDVILGAVGYCWNQQNGSPAKVAFVSHIENKIGRKLILSCAPNVHPLNIWHWKPRLVG